jgi:hypothetical protein
MDSLGVEAALVFARQEYIAWPPLFDRPMRYSQRP